MYDTKTHVVNLDVVGSVSVYVQGDLEKMRDGVVFLTVHGVGSCVDSWIEFTGGDDMSDIRKRALFLHVALPGQTMNAEDLPSDYSYPSLESIGLNLVTVLDQLRVGHVVGLGDTAGGNIILWLAINHPNRVHGVIGINVELGGTGGYKDTLKDILKGGISTSLEGLNMKNVSKYNEASRRKLNLVGQLGRRIKVDTLLIAGAESKQAEDAEIIHQEITAGLCSIIKLESVNNPLVEAKDKVAEALILFCQGQGLMPTINRRLSRQESLGSDGQGRKLSMSDFDTPNIRRLSLSTVEDEN